MAAIHSRIRYGYTVFMKTFKTKCRWLQHSPRPLLVLMLFAGVNLSSSAADIPLQTKREAIQALGGYADDRGIGTRFCNFETVSPRGESPRALASDESQKPEPASALQQVSWPKDPEHDRLLAGAERGVADAAARVAKDRFRPAFHLVPAGRFMNDPNGCVQFDNEYHMFFQHLPFWGEKNASTAPGWGHAVSRDLVHWKRLPIALMPVPDSYDAQAVASGCCVIDKGLPTIVYTSVPPQGQSLARSFDRMRTWRRYQGNPVIPKPPAIDGLEDGFRDPFVWREGGKWRMLVGSGIRGQGGTVLLYESADLVTWKFLGLLCTGMGSDCFQWECPNFFPLGEHWVLVVSPLLHSLPALRGPVQYTVGRYDGRHFEHGPWYPMDLGGPSVFYAPNSLQDAQGRRIQWGWVMGGGEPGSPWDGMLTMPRRLELGADLRLRISPVEEIPMLLRRGSLAHLVGRRLETGESVEVCRGVQMDVEVRLVRKGPGRLLMKLFGSAAGDFATVVGFDPASGELRCGDKVGIVPQGDRDLCYVRLLIDRSVIEVYVDDLAVMSLRVYPPTDADGFRLTAENGAVQLPMVWASRMGSIWEKGE